MMPLSSTLESREMTFTELRSGLEPNQFVLGGNWDYTNGSFDRFLDEDRKVWLRLPFEVINGHVDDTADENDAVIQLGSPFVLKHIYNEGNDPEAKAHVVGALFDQFQSPSEPNAPIEPKWIDRAKQVLSEVEQQFLH
ncbi:MAG: YugN family protein [Candidatus Pristimantibacillus sp.]